MVPGDIILIEPKAEVPCDLVIVKGESYVNESNITGETDPVPKSIYFISIKKYN